MATTIIQFLWAKSRIKTDSVSAVIWFVVTLLGVILDIKIISNL